MQPFNYLIPNVAAFLPTVSPTFLTAVFVLSNLKNLASFASNLLYSYSLFYTYTALINFTTHILLTLASINVTLSSMRRLFTVSAIGLASRGRLAC